MVITSMSLSEIGIQAGVKNVKYTEMLLSESYVHTEHSGFMYIIIIE